MKPLVLNRQQSRDVDRRAIEEYGMSGLVLMENAGRGVVDTLFQLGIRGRVTICCGKGNNAGDGFVMARHLDLRQAEVQVILVAEPESLTGDAQTNFAILRKTDVPIHVLTDRAPAAQLEKLLAGSDWIVDALLGTGAVGPPRPPLDQVIDLLNARPSRRLAVDLPSGLDCDLGIVSPHTFRAEHTCTFVAAKPGFYVSGADAYTGLVHILDIGAPRRLVESLV